MLGFESGSYFICTETSPRCFVLQQMTGSEGPMRGAKSSLPKQSPTQSAVRPPPPSTESQNAQPTAPSMMLPWWFTADCRQQLLNIPSFEALAQHAGSASYATISRAATPEQMTMEQLRNRLKHQLEYYFSRENLINDRYLRCQMDADQYVSIKIVAGFPKVAQLTNDFDLIVDVLRSSNNVQVDEVGKKVRPITKRCTIILREIPESATENDVKAMFDGCTKKFVSIAYGLNNSWYVTFEDEEATKLAFMHLKDLAFNDKPIHARIKTGNAPGNPNQTTSSPDYCHFAPTCVTPVPPAEKGDVVSTTSLGQIIVHDISHHYHNHSLHVQQQQNGRYLPIEVDTSLPSTITTTSSHSLSPNDTAGGCQQLTLTTGVTKPTNGGSPSSLNLGLLLAQYGYVPRATFRPNIAIPGVVVSSPTPAPTPTLLKHCDGYDNDSHQEKADSFDEDKENTLLGKKKRLISEISTLSADSVDTSKTPISQHSSGSSFETSSSIPPQSPQLDFGRQRITDVPRLNKDRCSPLMNGKPTANFIIGMNLVANGLYARLNAQHANGNASNGGGISSSDAPLAFTDGTNLNTIIDPTTLLSGPQIFSDVIIASVDERNTFAATSPITKSDFVNNDKSTNERSGDWIQGDDMLSTDKHLSDRHNDNRNSTFQRRNSVKSVSSAGKTFIGNPLKAADTNSGGRIVRHLCNRFSEGDEINYRTTKLHIYNHNNNSNKFNSSFYDNFSTNKYSNEDYAKRRENSGYNGGNKNEGDENGCNEETRATSKVFFNTNYSHNDGYRPTGLTRIRRSTYNAGLTSASTDDGGGRATMGTNTSFGNSKSTAGLLPLSTSSLRYIAPQQLTAAFTSERRRSHFANTFYNSNIAETTPKVLQTPPGRQQKRASLSSKEERHLSTSYAATVTNNRTEDHRPTGDSVSFKTFNSNAPTPFKSDFSFMDVEFPQLANDKRRGVSGCDEQPRSKKSAVDAEKNSANNACDDALTDHDMTTRRRSSVRVQFSAVVAGVHHNNDNKSQQQQYVVPNTTALAAGKYSSNNNNNNINNNIVDVAHAEKCSYAQTLKKMHR